MTLQASSNHARGVFVSIDGPSGAGKSTIVRHLADLLVSDGHLVHVTAEPSPGPIGTLCRELTESVTGHALACLYTADRYHHIKTEIRPQLEAGRIVISDRYIASGLVMQRFDGLDLDFLWQLNAQADQPDLAVILEADPDAIADRLVKRGRHNRYQFIPGSSHVEAQFYRQAIETLIQHGFNVLRLNCNQRPPQQSATLIRDQLVAFLETRRPASRTNKPTVVTPCDRPDPAAQISGSGSPHR